ncbi:MAG: YHS domain-containing (seleno)protein [Cyanobacteria bacterium P01_A01_bin.123]
MYLSSKFSSTLAAAFGLFLIVGCAPSTPDASPDALVDEPTLQTTTVDTDDIETSAPTEASAPTAESTSPPTEVSSSATEPAAVFVENGIAIRGADPVAYFTAGNYVAGSPEYTYEWGDAIWQFASAENRDLFASNAEQYAPQYGGFCAWAVSQGYTAAVDPTAWAIVDGKLYLNFDARVQSRWQRDIPGNIAKANQNWPGVLSN